MIAPKQLVTSPIRAEIERHLRSSIYTVSKLSELAKIDAGHLGSFLNGHPRWTLSVNQLDAIGQAFGKPVGWLYDLYVEECFRSGKVSKRRVKSYLVQCAEIGRYDCIQMVVPRVLEDPKHIEVFFDVAEQLFYKGRQKESIFFYQLVVNNEVNFHKKQNVMSRYRLFQMSEKTNTEMLWKAVLLFEPLRKGLSKHCQLDALSRLGNHCCTLGRWKEVGKYAEELLESVNSVYKDEMLKKKRGNDEEIELLNPERHLVAYYGQGYLLKALSLEKQGHYEQAKKFVGYCTDLRRFKLLGETGRVEVEKYKHLALEYMYRLDMLMGDTSVLGDYTRYLKDHPEGVLSGLVAILESANKHGFTVDAILDEFSNKIDSFNSYHDSIDLDHHLQFRYQLAIYQFKNERYQNGITETLRCLTLSIILNSSKEFIRCVALFEAYRDHATSQQERDYKIALEEVMRDERLIGRPHPHSEERPTVKH
ncbi:DNA-binding protein [Brevibacillus laterosporus]|uniref:DNA-binding protein n=1 Tax=Brevibacillus laterosporus TaxID=1465 RepID=UPI001125B4D9